MAPKGWKNPVTVLKGLDGSAEKAREVERSPVGPDVAGDQREVGLRMGHWT